MSIKDWIWKSVVAGLAGTIVHFAFMYLRSRLGLLPSFQPYPAFQTALSSWVGTDVPPMVPWLLSFLNGMTILGFLFARLKRLLPGRTGVSKGLSFGLIGWLFMGLIFFPLIGLGPFAVGVGRGIAPAMMSLGMVLTYSMYSAPSISRLTHRIIECSSGAIVERLNVRCGSMLSKKT